MQVPDALLDAMRRAECIRIDTPQPLRLLLLKDEYPESVTAYLIEGERYEIGAGLSPAVDAAVDRLVDLLLAKLGPEPAETAP